jgi:hypothetical protein
VCIVRTRPRAQREGEKVGLTKKHTNLSLRYLSSDCQSNSVAGIIVNCGKIGSKTVLS